MATRDSQDFRNDYPGGYSRNGYVYDGNGYQIGYVLGDGKTYFINKDDSNYGTYYVMSR